MGNCYHKFATFSQLLHLNSQITMSASRATSAKRHQTKKGLSKQKPASTSRPCRVPRPGQKCPFCGKGKLDYDGLLQLCCPACGNVASTGGFT